MPLPSNTPRPPRASQPPTPTALVFWIIWANLIIGVLLVRFLFGEHSPESAGAGLGPLAYILIAPVVLGSLVRWLVLPRVTTLTKQLPVFIIGVALCEGCGIIGTFLGGPEHRDTLVVVSLLGIVQWIPIWAKKT